MKKICPVCHREISVTDRGRIRRHGFKKDRWERRSVDKNSEEEYIRVDGKSCEGTGKRGLPIKENNELMINDLE